MKFKINLLMTGTTLLMAVTANAQFTVNGTNTYTNPLNNKVGIGTTTPADLLQVGSGITRVTTGSAYGVNTGYGIGYMGFNLARNSNVWSTITDGANNGGSVIYGDVGGSILFSSVLTTGATNQTNIPDATIFNNIKMSIKPDGKVGIGLNNPSARFQVASQTAENAIDVTYGGTCNFRVKSTGFVYARNLTIQVAAFPDYVFNENYKLMPLSEVNAFIKKHNHLPEMPTAAEVEKDGMSVSQINTLLVQKVEELTLYVIKLQEEVDQLKIQK